jgi:hypothetical protein
MHLQAGFDGSEGNEANEGTGGTLISADRR